MNLEHERARVLRERAEDWPIDRAAVEAEFPLPWRTHGLLARIVFFVLTCAGIGALVGLTEAELFAGIVSVVIGEFLIRGRRWFWTGVEEALWLGGLACVISELPRTGTPEANLVMAAGAGVAGFRVRNPLFGALAAIFITIYLERVADLGTLAALLIALASLIALYRTWKRPSTEWLFVALLVVMPLAGAFQADSRWWIVTIALYTAFSLIAFVSAIAKRHHAMFIAAAVSLAIAASFAHERLRWREEATFALAGVLLLALAWLVAHLLRDRTTGFVMTPAKLTPFDDELQSIGTIAVAAPSAGNPPEARPQGEGGFGGAGATGDF